MSDYDFTALSPYDFELLCADLLNKQLRLHFHNFKNGRDGGIDLRYASNTGNVIVQCKHYAGSKFADLFAKLRDEELPKIRKLLPRRYLLATSLPISPLQAEKLCPLLKPFCKSPQDVYGRHALNTILRANPKIEKSHFKLWLTSTAVLERVLHSSVFTQTEMEKAEIVRKLRLYVQTKNVGQAQRLLNTKRCCVITGVPGIGKTTLAQMLLIHYLMNGWEVVSIHQNITEGLDIYEQSNAGKQVFYYDDFLGQVSFGEKLPKNEERGIEKLMRMVGATANKRFILTTREYILEQAKASHEVLARTDWSVQQFIVELSSYSMEDKARMLLNHLLFFEVPREHVLSLVTQKTYRRIVRHANFNPRLLEWMTDPTRVGDVRSADYPTRFLEVLDNPALIWEHIFDNQILESSRHLLLVLASCGSEVMLTDLEEAFWKFYHSRAKTYGFATSALDFKRALKELTGSLVRVERSEDGDLVLPHNPSVVDFLANHLLTASSDFNELLTSVISFDQIVRTIAIVTRKMEDSNREAFLGERSLTIGNAVAASLDTKSMSMHVYRDPTGRITLRHQLPVKLAERLAFGIRLGTSVTNSKMRIVLSRRVETMLGSASVQQPDVSGIIEVVDACSKSGWAERRQLRKWIKAASDYLTKLPASLDDATEQLRWVHKNTANFSAGAIDEFDAVVREYVRDDVPDLISTEESGDTLDDMALALEEIGETLGMKFRDQINAIEERKEELPTAPQEDRDEWEGVPRPTPGPVFDIDEMFDSLR